MKNTKTFSLSSKDVEIRWHIVDAEDKPLGRVATEVVHLLRGKYRPTYTPHMDNGDFVIVVNAEKVRVTGSKSQQKIYVRHSGYPGGLKETPFERMLEKHPERIIQSAVKGMVPHNRLGRKILRHLKVYSGPDHPHEAQVNAAKGESAHKGEAASESTAKQEEPKKAEATA